jgi:hypothetical protein
MSTSSFNPFKIVEKVLKPKAPGPSLTFKDFHILEAIELMGKEGYVGRVKLSKELGLGEGVTRTLLKHLKDHNLITIDPKKGCKLTKKGEKVYKTISSRIVGPLEIPKNPITIGDFNVSVMVKNAVKAITYGLEQRDAAVKVGALGATTLIYTKNLLTMPGVEENCFKNNPEILSLIVSRFTPREGDVIIIGSASNPEKAKLGAKAAAFETLKRLYSSN